MEKREFNFQSILQDFISNNDHITKIIFSIDGELYQQKLCKLTLKSDNIRVVIEFNIFYKSNKYVHTKDKAIEEGILVGKLTDVKANGIKADVNVNFGEIVKRAIDLVHTLIDEVTSGVTIKWEGNNLNEFREYLGKLMPDNKRYNGKK